MMSGANTPSWGAHGAATEERQDRADQPSHVVFIDHEGTKFLFPFESSRHWDGFRNLLDDVYARVLDEKLKEDVRKNEFDITTTVDREIILPTVWESFVRPNLAVQISLWSEARPLRRLRRSSRGSSPRSVLSDRARQRRISDRSYESPKPPREAEDDLVVIRRGSYGLDKSSEPASFGAFERSEEQDDVSETSSEVEDDDTASLPEPPPPPRPFISPVDTDGNPLSFTIGNTGHWRPSAGEKIEQFGQASSAAAATHMKVESLKILKALGVSKESRMSVEMHTLSGPDSPATSDSINTRWYHLQGDSLDFAQFKSACMNACGTEHGLKDLIKEVLHKVERDNLKAFLGGTFIEPGTVFRVESLREDSLVVIFSCIPHFDIRPPAKSSIAKADRLHPPRSLMQSYYPYEPVQERDKEQAYRKFGSGSTENIIHVPHLWVMNIGRTAIVTCGHRPLSYELVKSIIVKPEGLDVVSASETSKDARKTSIRLSDWEGRVLHYSIDECRTYFQMEQKLRELKASARGSSSQSMRLTRRDQHADKDVTPKNWPEVIKVSKNIFIDLKVEDGEEEQKRTNKLSEPIVSDANLGSVPPFFLWPHAITDKYHRLRTKEILQNDTNQPSDDRKLGQNRCVECLEAVEKMMTMETLDEDQTFHPVDREFTTTAYYESLSGASSESAKVAFESLDEKANVSSSESASQTPHQTIVEYQITKIAKEVSILAGTARKVVQLFAPDLDRSIVLRRVWGAMLNIAMIVDQIQSRGAFKPDAAEFVDPEWKSPLTNRRCWYVRTKRSALENRFSVLPSGGEAMLWRLARCRSCRRNHGYEDPESAIEHVRSHLSVSDDDNLTKQESQDLAHINPQDWIRNEGQLVVEEYNAGFLAIANLSCQLAQTLLSETSQLSEGVRTEDGKKSDLYAFPHELLKSFQRIVVFFMAVERAFHHTDKCFSEQLTQKDMGNDFPFSKVGLEVLERFSESAKVSLLTARKDLCHMVHSKGEELDYRARMDLGPEYLCSWFMRRLLVRPVEKNMTVADLYREYLTTLQFQVNHHPSKRLLRSINLLQEELVALDRVNSWQLKVVDNYCRVLDDNSYQNDIPRRRAMFPHERMVLDSCRDNLRDAHFDYQELIERCGPLSETTKQSAEINEEDHGKAIFVFTVVTVIFLPLSFVTSYLGMNTEDIRDMTNNQTLFWEIAIPLTVVVMGSITLLAYKGDEVRDYFAGLGRSLSGKQSTSTRGISVAQRKRANKLSGSSSTLDYSSVADEAEYQSPYTRGMNYQQGLGPYFGNTEQPGFTKENITVERFGNAAQDTWQTYSGAFTNKKSKSFGAPAPLFGRSNLRSDNLFSGPPANKNLFSSAQNPTVPNPDLPTYVKIHRAYLDKQTLDTYGIPWEYDTQDSNYYILLKNLSLDDTEMLFEHTRILREKRKGRTGARVYEREEPTTYAWVKKRRGGDEDERTRTRTRARMF